ncbi:MAG: HAMP domain-containing sensor histidine kinase [Ignavibacteriales bacterium]|nr:HAMP domain-containing sensor histidine kinase [Ignavibacteriales bacterium]
MKTVSLIKSTATGSVSLSGRLKIILMVIAFIIIAGTLWYTHNLVQALSQKEKEVADIYAKSYVYIANNKTGEGDYNFLFNEIINTVDFPVVLTDRNNEPELPYDKNIKNISLNSNLPGEEQRQFLKNIAADLDRSHAPIKVTYQDTIILSYLHYGESTLIVQLRWLPYVELAVAALFILIGYISFSYIKRSEQSNIWVGMARETAHQLGTPISSMLGWVELLKEQSEGDKKTTETLLDMESDLHRLQKIADRFSKIGSKPDLHEEDLSEVIGKVTEYFQRRIPQTGKKVHLVIESSKAVRAHINRELFEWVLENLTKNALDAIENGEGTIAFSLSEHGNHAFVDISDTGKGITSKHRNDVFRPGFSTKKRGWGLGLSLSKRIIETYHSGRLFLKENNAGFKTTFRIKLNK